MFYNAGTCSRINFSTTSPDSHFLKWVQEQPYLQILLCFSSVSSNLVGKVFLCGRSWPQLQLRNEGTPPDFEAFFLEKRPWKCFSTNVLIRGEMNPLHKHKVMSVGYQVKQNFKSRSWKLVYWLMIAFITCKSSLVPLLEGLCTSNPCRCEFSIFWVFAGVEPTTSGLTVQHSDQLS